MASTYVMKEEEEEEDGESNGGQRSVKRGRAVWKRLFPGVGGREA